MTPVMLLLETETKTWSCLVRLAALPTFDGRTVITVGGVPFTPLELRLKDGGSVARVSVGGYAGLTTEKLIESGWMEEHDETTP